MKKDIILAGVGGQGILTIAAIIGTAAITKGLYLKQAEVHGMSQRGGDVQSHLRISSDEIYSDLIPFGGADMIISVEPMESLRYLPYLSTEGWIISNTKPMINIENYPTLDALKAEIGQTKQHTLIDADDLAKELGNARAMNMIVLGAAIPNLGISVDEICDAVRTIFKKKGDAVINLNIEAIKLGLAEATK